MNKKITIKVFDESLLQNQYYRNIVSPKDKVRVLRALENYALMPTSRMPMVIYKCVNEFSETVFKEFSLISFKEKCANDMVTIEVPSKRKDGPCELKEVSIADIWLKSPDRQTYSYLTFDPKNKVNPDCLNTYLGFTHCEYLAHEQYDDGLLNEYLDLILRLANNDHAVYAYVVKWMASIVQFPWRKTRTSIVFKGGQGTGKGTVLTGFKAVCGSMGLYAKSASHIFSQFDSHFQGKLFCFADEALFSGSKKDQDLFKSMITQKHTSFQAKGRDIVTGVDYVNFGLASNSEWTVDVDSDDRRFLIVKTSSDSGLVNEGHKDKSSAEYLALMAMFKRLNEAFDDGILHKHLYRYLLEMDLTGFETNVIPYTDAKIDEKLYSASSAIKFIHEVLSEGVVSQLFANPAGGKVPSKILNEEFQAWINENNVRHHNNRVEIKSLVNILKLESYRTNDARGYILPTKILAKQYLCVRIPHQTGQPVHGKLDTDSRPNWTVIPRQTGQRFQSNLDSKK